MIQLMICLFVVLIVYISIGLFYALNWWNWGKRNGRTQNKSIIEFVLWVLPRWPNYILDKD